MLSREFSVQPFRQERARLKSHKMVQVKKTVPRTPENAASSYPYADQPHKNIIETKNSQKIIDFDLDEMVSRMKERDYLKKNYILFYNWVDLLQKRYSDCDPADASSISDFTVDLISRAWISLVPGNYSIAGIFVPDLVFARCDLLTPKAFAAGIDAQTHAYYDRIVHAWCTRNEDIVGQHSTVLRMVCDRIAAEAHLHRPIAGLFWEVADAR